jgi:tetratricopeptide (TPR) repeat protein
MLFTVRVTGTGNVKLFPRPSVVVPWAAVVPADERVRVDSAESRIQGVKEFDWVLTPRIAGEFDVPPVRYGYFDPTHRRYEVTSTPGQRIRVAEGALASDTGQAVSVLAIRPKYGGPASPPLQSRPAFWLIMALAPLPAIAAHLRKRAARPNRTLPPDPVRALSVNATDDPATLRRRFVKALAHRLGCSAEDFTHPGALLRALRRAGVSDGTAAQAESLLRALDAAAFAPSAALPHPSQAAHDVVALVRAIDAEALSRAELPFWIPAVLVVVSLGVVGSAIAADNAASHFARGVSGYVRQDYGDARRAFADAVAQAPTAPDAWANYGTASWATGDTAAAVLGWRQVLAIEPDAADVRHHLGLFREAAVTSPGWVPAVPRNASVILFAVLWLGAWTLAWLALRRASAGGGASSWAGRAPLPLAVCALLVGLVAIELETRIAGTRLAVVRRAVILTSDPAIGMDRGPVVGTAEIVRVAGRRGTWTRVEATDDRDGWIASAELLLLADRRAPRN